ncbi:MAG: aminomethyltransferase family protein, partial [Actinomycetes bacterium]
QLLEDQGALFGSKMGWERANVFAPAGSDRSLRYTWERPDWLAWSCDEQRATREAVAVFDQTSFGKFEVSGADAEALMQRVCSANVAVEPGRTVYTAMLNTRGGYEADVTVTRTAADRYLVVTGSASIVRDIDWVSRHLQPGERVAVTDVTDELAVFGVMGPGSRDLLQPLTATDLSDEEFPFSTSQLLDVRGATVRATRITYVGELGWELYVPVEHAVDVYRALFDAGGAVPAGYYAINSLRLDMGYRAFGSDLTPDLTPVEAGLMFTCDLSDESDFIGRAAVERVRADGPRRRLASLVVNDPDVMLWGGELLRRNGAAVGQVTSAAWSQTMGAAVGLAYVWQPDGSVVSVDDVRGDDFVVMVGDRACAVTVSRRAPHRKAEATS